jgi:menaquinol-cytochrome c reductase iron-sulfur subunit
MDRRGMMKLAIGGIAAATGGMVGVPAFVTAFSPLWKHEPETEAWQSLGPLQNYPPGEMTETVVEIPRKDWSDALGEEVVYAWRPSEEEVIVFSRSCTDLGCPLNWDPGSECFFCPCHGGIFAKNGERMAGPPKRPMYRYATRIREGELEIDVRSVPPKI